MPFLCLGIMAILIRCAMLNEEAFFFVSFAMWKCAPLDHNRHFFLAQSVAFNLC